MTVEQYTEQLEVAYDAAETALDNDDMETHIEWAKAYHRLASKCLAEHGVELRPEVEGPR